MTIRCLWVLSPKLSQPVLYVKTYPIIEKKAKELGQSKNNYVWINHKTVHGDIIKHFAPEPPGIKFSASRDSCLLPDERPFASIQTEQGILSPMVVLEHNNLLFCCLMLQKVEPPSGRVVTVEQTTDFALCLSFLQAMADFCEGLPSNVSEVSPKIVELSLFVSDACRFGTPLQTNCTLQKQLLAMKPTFKAPTHKLPAWKPVLHKGRNSIQVTLTERLTCVQYGDMSHRDTWRVDGVVTCLAELEGAQTKASLLLSPRSPTAPQLKFISYHHTVMAATKKQKEKDSGYLVEFMPPLEIFDLCVFEAVTNKTFLNCKYYVKEEDKIGHIHIQFTLSCSEPKVAFQYLQVCFPFLTREKITDHKMKVTTGHVSVSSRAPNMLVWNVGQRLPGDREVSLQGTVALTGTADVDSHSDVLSKLERESILFQGQMSYAKVMFKVHDFTLSSYMVDPQSVSVMSGAKSKVSIDAPVSFQPSLSELEAVYQHSSANAPTDEPDCTETA